MSGTGAAFTRANIAITQANIATALRSDLAVSNGAALVNFAPTVTGSVAKTVQDKLRNVVSIFDFLTAAQTADVQSYTASIDMSAALQSLINALSSSGGGTIRFEHGCALLASPIQMKSNVAIVGGGGAVYGFSSQTAGSTFKQLAGATGSVVNDVIITAGGTGYANGAITFSNGGTGFIYTTAGVITGVVVTDCGSPTTASITANLTGGTGATLTVQTCVPMFYQSGTTSDTIVMRDITLIGNGSQTNAGVVISNGVPWFSNFHAYQFGLSAWKRIRGAGGQVINGRIFGMNRNGLSPGSTAYYCGTLDEGGSDLQLANLEIGGAQSGDTTNLWNSAVRISGTAGAMQAENLVCEGSDTGILCSGSNNMFVNVRCDINYGHGFWMHRTNVALSPPQLNKIWGIWCHRNSHYATNTYDNFRIESGDSISGAHVSGYSSTYSSGDTWAHRYGLYDGSGSALIEPFIDSGALTAKFGSTSSQGTSPVQVKTALTAQTAAASLNVTGLRELQINAAGAPVTVSALTGGNHGDDLVLWINGTNITLGHSGPATSTLYLAGKQNRLCAQWDCIYLRNRAGGWIEVSPWAKQAAIGAATVTYPTLTAPNANETAMKTAYDADIAALKTRIDALATALQAAGVTA